MAVKVSPKYQVVIPESVREILKIKPGMKVEVIAKSGIAYLVPVESIKSLQETFKGKLSLAGLREKQDRRL
jgi:AbrB family looped-hinge helix DNA binding protein